VKDLPIIIVTGLSGSGKSSAIAALADVGFYCVDNMPVDLLPKFLELPIESGSGMTGLAFVMDLREKGFLAKHDPVLSSLRQKGFSFEILFLEADEKVLVQRYSATRRQHPLAQGKGIVAAIQLERQMLQPLRDAADRIIDSTRLNVHELKARVIEIAQARRALAPMQVNILSFGFKYGIPPDADLVVDVRFLPNPYFVPDLKHLDGEAREIQDFIFGAPEAREFIARYTELIDYLIPLYEREGKANLSIAIGCTGGRHRSVAIARTIYDRFAKARRGVGLIHRDIQQPT
jgi:UPF0042 nucleotide-binding protein